MGIFDRFKKATPAVAPEPASPPAPKPKRQKAATKKTADADDGLDTWARLGDMSPKDTATLKGEPWVSVVKVDLDPDNIGNGAFELDWNEKFIVNLVRQGYQSKPGEDESAIVDRWFQDVCRNVVQENYEQWEANQPYESRPRVLDRRDLGDGKTEIS
jgi:hypothetical protein